MIKKVLLHSVLILGVTSPVMNLQADRKMASEVMQPPLDPKKKRPGEQCNTSDECQRHHSCEKNGDKGICTAPPRRKIPPGAVT